jgi:hypothetical protein
MRKFVVWCVLTSATGYALAFLYSERERFLQNAPRFTYGCSRSGVEYLQSSQGGLSPHLDLSGRVIKCDRWKFKGETTATP